MTLINHCLRPCMSSKRRVKKWSRNGKEHVMGVKLVIKWGRCGATQIMQHCKAHCPSWCLYPSLTLKVSQPRQSHCKIREIIEVTYHPEVDYVPIKACPRVRYFSNVPILTIFYINSNITHTFACLWLYFMLYNVHATCWLLSSLIL